MTQKTEILTAVGTLACALGIGFVMQSGEVAQMRYGSTTIVALETNSDVLPLQVQDITLTSAEVPLMPVLTIEDAPDLDFLPMSPPAQERKIQMISSKPLCDVSLSAAVRAPAMVDLSLSAPCFAKEDVVVSHAEMRFSATTAADGTLNVSVPALMADAVFEVVFESGPSETVRLRVESVMLYDRVVVQWQGAQGLQIHAREYGADYGDAGHVWIQNPRNVRAAGLDSGGFLTRHGEPEAPDRLLAEVYTFPSALSDTKSSVQLTLEAEVTEANCGTEIAGQTMEILGGKLMQTQRVSLKVPDCDAVGEYLVLNNLLQGLTVASS